MSEYGGTVEGGGRSEKKEEVICFGSYNIKNGHNGGLESALYRMYQANIDLGILKKTNITDGVYTRKLSGFWVVATKIPSHHRGSVILFYKESRQFLVETLNKHGPNVHIRTPPW